MIIRLIAVVILFLVDLYVFQAIKVFGSDRSEALQKIIYLSFWSLSALSLGIIILSGLFDYNSWPKLFRQYSFGFIVIFYLSKIFVIPFLFIDDIIRLGKLVMVWIQNKRVNSEDSSNVISRLEFLNYLGLLIASIPFFSLLYGMLGGGAYNYKVRKLKLQFSRLPENLSGLRIVQISDLHLGSFPTPRHLKKAIELVKQQQPDIILFTGDLVNNKAEETDQFILDLSEIKAPMGIFSILGNHDYGDYIQWSSSESKQANLNRLKDIHKELGWKLLLNENITLEKEGEKIVLVGVENWSSVGRFPKYGNLKKAIQGINDNNLFKILLTHDPSHWSAEVILDYKDIDLTLSGHTHGFQFGVELPGFKWSPIQYLYKHWAGLYKNNQQYLYVNRGLGFVGYPGRLGIMPEITVFDLSA